MKDKKYLKFGDEFYKLVKISFFYWMAEVQETTLTEAEVDETEVIEVSELKHFKIILR